MPVRRRAWRLQKSFAGSVRHESRLAAAICAVIRLLHRVQPAPELVEVKVPVPVPCKAVAPAVPVFAVESLALDATIDQQMKVLRAERLQRIGYERELLAALQVCR